MPGDSDLLIAARAALLDALEALGPHAENVIVVGAQAIYMQTGRLELAIAELTKDADLALNGQGLSDDPTVEEAMRSSGFYPNPDQAQPGAWCSPDGMPVDVMVPEALAGPSAKNRRGSRLPPHANDSMRRAVGLEACVVDFTTMDISALDPRDGRSLTANVAGPAALLVAKLHKVGERLDDGRRVEAKDAHDIYRLLRGHDSDTIATTFSQLLEEPISAEASAKALAYLQTYFATPDGAGADLAGRAELGVGDPDQVAAATAALSLDLLELL